MAKTKAIKALESYIKGLLAPDDPKTSVTVYAYEGRGLRISEISVFTRQGRGGSGCSWMRSEPEAGAVILQAEEFLLTYGVTPESFSSDPEDGVIDLHGEAKWRLEFVLTHKLAETR